MRSLRSRMAVICFATCRSIISSPRISRSNDDPSVKQTAEERERRFHMSAMSGKAD